MARDGNGTFVRLYNWEDDRDASIPITASRMDAEQDGIAVALTNSLAKDGQTNPSANLPMNSFKHTGVANANARDQYAAVGQLQDNAILYAVGGGTANAQTLTLAPAITAYTDGMLVHFEAGATNTDSATLNVNSVSADTIVLPNGDALPAGALTSGNRYSVMYDNTNSQWVLMSGNHIDTGSVVISEATTSDIISITGNSLTTGDIISITGNSLTTGSAIAVSSSSSSTSARNLVEIRNTDSASVNTTCLDITQAADHEALDVVSSNLNGFSVYIQCDSLTNGGGLTVNSDSSDGSVRNLVEFVNDNSSAGGTRVLFINQDADGRSIYIDSESSTADVLDIEADALTTGSIIRAYSNSSSNSIRTLVEINNDNTGADQTTCLFISQDADEEAISITTQSAAAAALDITANSMTTGDVLSTSANSLTTGSIATFYSNSASTSSRNLVEIVNDSSSADNADCLFINQDADGDAINIDVGGNGVCINIDSAQTTTSVISIACDALTTGTALNIDSNSSDTNNRDLVRIVNNNSSATSAQCLSTIQDSGDPNTRFRVTNASFSSRILEVFADRSASSAFSLIACLTDGLSDTEFNFRGDGEAFADGSFTGGGADYAEYFEWEDANPDNEDRRGIVVVTAFEKIRPFNPDIDTQSAIIGVVSANPAVVGDSCWNKWSEKYLRDDFGSYVMEDYEVAIWDTVNEKGEKTTVTGNVEDNPDLPKNAKITTQQRRKLNPDWDPDREYIPREQRKEWSTVGLMGKLRVRKGQSVNPNWIKLRDISETVEEWLVR